MPAHFPVALSECLSVWVYNWGAYLGEEKRGKMRKNEENEGEAAAHWQSKSVESVQTATEITAEGH